MCWSHHQQPSDDPTFVTRNYLGKRSNPRFSRSRTIATGFHLHPSIISANSNSIRENPSPRNYKDLARLQIVTHHFVVDPDIISSINRLRSMMCFFDNLSRLPQVTMVATAANAPASVLTNIPAAVTRALIPVRLASMTTTTPIQDTQAACRAILVGFQTGSVTRSTTTITVVSRVRWQ